MSKITAAKALAYSKMLVAVTPRSVSDPLTEPAHQFATYIHAKAQEAGISPVEMCYAVCELLASYMVDDEFKESIYELATVSLAGIIATKLDPKDLRKEN